MENEAKNGIGFGIDEVALVVQSLFPDHKILENTSQKRRRFFLRLEKLRKCVRGRDKYNRVQHTFLAKDVNAMPMFDYFCMMSDPQHMFFLLLNRMETIQAAWCERNQC